MIDMKLHVDHSARTVGIHHLELNVTKAIELSDGSARTIGIAESEVEAVA